MGTVKDYSGTGGIAQHCPRHAGGALPPHLWPRVIAAGDTVSNSKSFTSSRAHNRENPYVTGGEIKAQRG